MSFNLKSGVVLASWVFSVGTAFASDGGKSLEDRTAERPRAALSVWDTGTSSGELLAPGVLEKKNGWKPIASSEVGFAFQGDAVIANGRLLAVARREGIGVELYSLGSGKPVFRARLALVPGQGLDSVALTENTRSAVGLDVTSKSGTVHFRLKKGEHFLESQALSGEAPLRVECPSRFALLPDFFADDILFDAHKVPLDKVELPSENF